MRWVQSMRSVVVGGVVALAVVAPSTAQARASACRPVKNPFAGTRYAGADLTKIRARHVSCPRARKVARGANHKALGITPPVSGIRRFRWHGYRVVGNLRGRSDRYLATKGSVRVRWRF